MKIKQFHYSKDRDWEPSMSAVAEQYHLVIGFGAANLLQDQEFFSLITRYFPGAEIAMCSTAGEISDTEVHEESLSLVALQFSTAVLQTAEVDIKDFTDSFHAGYELAGRLKTEGLKSVLLLADGQLVNGSELMLAFNEFLPGVPVGGGMAGDGARFRRTLVGLNHPPESGQIVAIGLYGSKLTVSHGSMGGWDTFGVERLITRAEKNILYELDGRPALDIYKLYLGEYAADLPQSGLFFPLAIRNTEADNPVVRTILAVDEQNRSLTFAGNMPEGSYAQMMKASHDRLIDGAAAAAERCMQRQAQAPQLALLISCVGRKLVLGQRIEEEAEAVRAVFGDTTVIAGFYSYGEFAPAEKLLCGELHNQTMTIITISEDECI